VRRAVNTPDINGRFALWQGGMEPNIPVGSPEGVKSGMKSAVAGAEREQREGASGKWVAHWKMVHIVRPVWEKARARPTSSAANSPADLHATGRGRPVPARTGAAHRSRRARPAERGLQYGNAFGQGMQAAASSRPTSSATTTCST
jgi:malate synthase